MALMSLEEIELRTLAKRANQRLVRLERWMKKHNRSSAAYEQAEFYLEDVVSPGRKMRFPENPQKLSEDEKQEIRFKVTAFLNNSLSQVSEQKKRDRLLEEIRRVEEEDGAAPGLLSMQDENRPVGDTEENSFWVLFDTAKNIGLTKLFDYRTIAKALSWKIVGSGGDSDVVRRVTQVLHELSAKQDINRRKLLDAIGRA